MDSSAKALLIASVLAIGLAGCKNKDIGTLSGGALGGVLGSMVGKGDGKLLAIGVGSIAGAMLGSQIGERLDKGSQQKVDQQFTQALEYNRDGQAQSWQDPNKNVGAVTTPMRTYQASSGEQCREFQQEIQIGGETENGYGTACRQADGSWKISG